MSHVTARVRERGVEGNSCLELRNMKRRGVVGNSCLELRNTKRRGVEGNSCLELRNVKWRGAEGNSRLELRNVKWRGAEGNSRLELRNIKRLEAGRKCTMRSIIICGPTLHQLLLWSNRVGDGLGMKRAWKVENPFKILFGNSYGKISPGRPKHRRIANFWVVAGVALHSGSGNIYPEHGGNTFLHDCCYLQEYMTS
jgi:hypothetical protein